MKNNPISATNQQPKTTHTHHTQTYCFYFYRQCISSGGSSVRIPRAVSPFLWKFYCRRQTNRNCCKSCGNGGTLWWVPKCFRWLVLKTAHPFSNAPATEPSTPGVQVLGFATRHAQIWVRSSIEFLVPEERGEKEKSKKAKTNVKKTTG